MGLGLEAGNLNRLMIQLILHPMKKQFQYSLLAFGWVACLGGMAAGCQRVEISEDISQATIQADEGQGTVGHSADPCTGVAHYAISASLISPAAYDGYDLAVNLGSGSPTLGATCFCKNTHIQLMVKAIRYNISQVGIAVADDQSDPIDIIYDYDPSFPGDSTLFSTFNWEADKGNVALFKFANGHIPIGPNLNNFIASAGGLCLVDNIHDPKDSYIRGFPIYQIAPRPR